MSLLLILVCFHTLSHMIIAVREGRVTSFNNSVSGPVTAGTHLIFNCQAIAEDAHWIINGTTRLRSFSGFTIITNFIGGNFDHWNLTLSTTATLQYNNTVIECTARGTTSNQHDTRTAYIRIAGPPLSPHPFMGFESNGSILTVMWEEPFSMDGFPVTSYNLSVYNHTSGSSYSHLMYPPQLEYNISNPLVSSTNCHTLTFSVTAINSVGSSEEDNVSGGFPIIPQDVFLEAEVVFLVNGNPRITTQFQVPRACPFQLPANYTIEIVDESGNVVTSNGPKPANSTSGLITEDFIAGVERNHIYSAVLTFSHCHIPGEIVIIRNDIVASIRTSTSLTTDGTSTLITTDSTSSDKLVTIGMVLVVIAVVVCLVVTAIIVSIICVRKRGRRPAISGHIEVPIETISPNPGFKLAPPPKGKGRAKPPTSLLPMAVNPIYEGPMYDSPGGESFKCLLGNSSTPNTPMTNTPLTNTLCATPHCFDTTPSLPPPRKGSTVPAGCASVPTTPIPESPRYFDMPPSLPPPRKASVCAMPQLPPGIPEEPVELSCVDTETYTEMKPLHSTDPRSTKNSFALYEDLPSCNGNNTLM